MVCIFITDAFVLVSRRTIVSQTTDLLNSRHCSSVMHAHSTMIHVFVENEKFSANRDFLCQLFYFDKILMLLR